MFKIEKISVGYGRKTVLKEISQDFEKKKLTCIIGKNGCGKSTLLKAMTGIIPLQEGRLILDDCNLSEMKPAEIARKVAYLAQGKTVPDMTVEQLVLHGRFSHLSYPRIYRQTDKEIAKAAMEKMGISDFAKERLTALSGGMCQKAYIAMALTQNTDFILMDEPTTYLDVGNRIKLMYILKALTMEGKGVIVVLHELPLAMEYADEVVVIDEERIAMRGTPEEICSSDIIEKVFDVKLNRCETENRVAYYI